MPDFPRNAGLVDAVRRDLTKRLLGLGAGAALAATFGPTAFAAPSRGPQVPDVAPTKLSEHLYIIYARGGFPSRENQGFFANIALVLTKKGVVVFDSGTSVQIGEMAIRQIKRLTDKPVIAVINSHFHGDHWLGNQAFREAWPDVPLYAHPDCVTAIRKAVGEQWLHQMMGATEGAIEGTRVVGPDTPINGGHVFDMGDVTLKVHYYGQAHTPVDLMLEIVQDKIVLVGDAAMDHRIANMEDGSFNGTFKVYDELEAHIPGALWVPGHGHPDRDMLKKNRELLMGIYDNAAKAVEAGGSIEDARAAVLKDPRVTKYARDTVGFDESIGKFISIAYLEAEQKAF
ncbi:MAG: MBL fold metallo-hydrolase [Halothiobacillaceae bacterium]|nr:MBL fold metallo-hydrolase [Halothiobacillaceae bacterium]